MSPRSILFVSERRPRPGTWADEWGELRVVSAGEAAADPGAVDVALIDGELSDPLAAVRALHGADESLQPIVLARRPQRERLERALLFTPGVGETWIRSDEELDEALLERASAITARRRSFRHTRRHIQAAMPAEVSHDVRPFVTDAYLAALLQVLPDPAAALDEAGRVVFWSPAAQQVLGVSAAQAAGRPLDQLLRTDSASWQELLGRAATEVVRGELSYRTLEGEERSAVLGLSPILIGGRRATAALLHDVTEERRAYERLQEQADELEQQTVELEQQAEALQQYATEKDALLAERNRTLVALERAIEVRSRFYASMNHEIRTPINAILGYTDLLLNGTYGELSPAQQRALLQSGRAAKHLIEIVNDLLDLSKLEAGRIELQIAPVRVDELVEDLLATTRPLAEEHGCELHSFAADCRTSIITDPRRVRQILLNLVSNAVKFGEHKPVEMHCRDLGAAGVSIDVVDQGIGIAAEDLPRIFEEFVQVGRPRSGGTGLGLAISRRLATSLGGELSVESQPGRGSTFRLRLPRKVALTEPRDETRAG